METVRRLAAAIIVALLTAAVSGISAVTVTDPCAASEPTGTERAACPDTCEGCGCCVETAEIVSRVLTIVADSALSDPAASLPRMARTNPRDILHVPKARLS
jgi:hypothetical protein